MPFSFFNAMAAQHAFMTLPTSLTRKLSSRSVRKGLTRLGSGLLAASLSLSVALPGFAADPFRSGNPYEMGDLTEQAFEAIFKDGNYPEAAQILAQAEAAEPNEPLVHAMLASMAYLEGESGLPEVLSRAQLTKQTAASLLETQPLRGHLYTAVGTFLEGAHLLKTQGVAEGTPEALGMLQEVFTALDAAEAIDENDPELNLLKGYMDLMLAVNLPFANPDDAISRMQAHGSPDYLTQRGIAIGYRDLSQYDNALTAVDSALVNAPNNPELFYLKAQILVRQGNQADSVALFNQALEYKEQLPQSLADTIVWEGCLAEGTDRGECVERAFGPQS